MQRIEIRLFGAPRIEQNGELVSFDTRKALALLSYLVVTGRRQRRDSLAALLWPDGDQSHARAALRRTLSTLNAGLGDQALTTNRETIELSNVADMFVDVIEFRRLLTPDGQRQPGAVPSPGWLDRLRQAVDLYRDDFMAGFSLRDSPEFEEWQFNLAEQLRREFGGALERLSTMEAAAGDFGPAIAHARRWLVLDPLSEPAHRQLMRLYAWSGERAAALRQYQECVRVLDRELNVGPLEATAELYQAITHDRLEPPIGSRVRAAAVQVQPRAASVTEIRHPSQPVYPLVGRAGEKARLFACFDSIQQDGRFVVIQGEAGIGKSRLVDELVAHARERGAAVMASRCYEGELQLAYGPFVEGLKGILAQPEWLARVSPSALVEVVRLLPELATLRPGLPLPLPLESPGALSRFFDGLGQVLRGHHHEDVPSVIVIDDVHRADDASLDLLTYLARRLAGWPVCLVVTWRDDDVPAEHRLRQLLAEVQRQRRAESLTLGRLSRTDVIKLARLSPQSMRLSDRLVEQLYRDSEGVPFFVIEYLSSVDDDSEVLPSGRLPRGVHDLLLSRLATIHETGRQLLSTAAIIGRSFDFDTLRDASGRGEEETVDGLEELVGRGLIREIQSPEGQRLTYDFSHDKLRAVVEEEMSHTRRRLLHGRVAAALESHPRRPAEIGQLASQIAFHLRQAGLDVEAAHFFRLAGEHARSLYANISALAYFRSALALGDPETDAIREAVGDIEVLTGDYSAALTSYQQVQYSDPEQLIRLRHKLGMLHNRRGDWEAAEAAFDTALSHIDPDSSPDMKARVLADWSLTNHLRGNDVRALELGTRALSEAEALGDARSQAQVHNLLGVLARARRDLDEALIQLEQSMDFARQLSDPGATTAALNNLALVRAERGEFDEALALATAGLERCRAQGDRHREAALHNNLADFHHRAGQPEAAMSHLKQAVAIFAEIGGDGAARQPEIWKLVEW